MGYRLSASGTLLNHLATCKYQIAAIHERAIQDPACTIRRPGVQASRNQSRSLQRAVTLPNLNNVTSFSQLPYNVATEGTSNPGSPMVLSPLIMATGPLGVDSRPMSPALTIHNSIPTVISSGQDPVASQSNLLFQQPSDSLRALTPVIRPITPLAGGSLIWTTDRQAAFENRLARLTACAGLPLSWVDNPEWIEFCEEFLPAAKSPSRKVLTVRVIPKLVEQFRNQSMTEVEGKDATMQADGWTGENHRHIIAYMITANQKVFEQTKFPNYIDPRLQIHTIKVDDVSIERKTAEIFLQQLKDTYEEVEQRWKAMVVAVVTDASGECRKARREFLRDHPWVVVIDCYAHQVFLLL